MDENKKILEQEHEIKSLKKHIKILHQSLGLAIKEQEKMVEKIKILEKWIEGICRRKH